MIICLLRLKNIYIIDEFIFDMVIKISKVDNNICKKYKIFIYIFEFLI